MLLSWAWEFAASGDRFYGRKTTRNAPRASGNGAGLAG
jgi:hypothetical protein